MFQTIYEPLHVSQYIQEYYDRLIQYQNVRRSAFFVKYLNVNTQLSNFTEADTTYDRYHIGDVKFDLYEFTPVFYLTPVSNMPISMSDIVGHMLDGMSTVTIYTIENVRINDLIAFYEPIISGEIFRVNNFRTQVSLMKESVKFFEIYLEYAPVKSIDEVEIVNHYVYDLPLERYLTRQQYDEKIRLIEQLADFAKMNILPYYNKTQDLFTVSFNNSTVIPVELNLIVGEIKRYFGNNYYRLNNYIYKPFNFYLRFPQYRLELPQILTIFNDRDTFTYLTESKEEYLYFYKENMIIDNNLLKFTDNVRQFVEIFKQIFAIDNS